MVQHVMRVFLSVSGTYLHTASTLQLCVSGVTAVLIEVCTPYHSCMMSYKHVETQKRIPFLINFHIFKSGGTHAEKIYATARDQVCGPGSSSNLARSFPLACDLHYRRPWICGVHFSWVAAQQCLQDDRRMSGLSLQSDLVTSVIVLRNPPERYVSEFHHKARYYRKHCLNIAASDFNSTLVSIEVQENCRHIMGSMSGFSALQQQNDQHLRQSAKHNEFPLLQDYLKHECTGGENRLTWTMSSHFSGSSSYAAYCMGNNDLANGSKGKRNKPSRGTLWEDSILSEQIYQEALRNLREVSIVGTFEHLELVFEALSDVFNIAFDVTVPRDHKEHQKYAHLDFSTHIKNAPDDTSDTNAQTLEAVRKKVFHDQRLIDQLIGTTSPRRICINWNSWLGRKLIHLGLKSKYS